MPERTCCFCAVHGDRAAASQHILAVRNRLQMHRIAARSVPTQVVELGASWDWADTHFIRHTMGTLRHRRVTSTALSKPDVTTSISSAITTTGPNNASAILCGQVAAKRGQQCFTAERKNHSLKKADHVCSPFGIPRTCAHVLRRPQLQSLSRAACVHRRSARTGRRRRTHAPTRSVLCGRPTRSWCRGARSLRHLGFHRVGDVAEHKRNRYSRVCAPRRLQRPQPDAVETTHSFE